jgi:hypothetical protein
VLCCVIAPALIEALKVKVEVDHGPAEKTVLQFSSVQSSSLSSAPLMTADSRQQTAECPSLRSGHDVVPKDVAGSRAVVGGPGALLALLHCPLGSGHLLLG